MHESSKSEAKAAWLLVWRQTHSSMPEFVEHLVLLRLQRAFTASEVRVHPRQRPNSVRSTRATQVEEIMQLKQKIPGVVAVSCGENYTNRSQGFTYGVVGSGMLSSFLSLSLTPCAALHTTPAHPLGDAVRV